MAVEDTNGSSNETGSDLSELEEKIIQQVEYYFGDINLPRDKFLQDQMRQAEDGWIPLTTMIKFNRLKQLSEDFKVICNALKKSTNGLIEVDVEKEQLRRTKDLPENSLEYWNTVKSRTLYVKGFPQDAKLDELQAFFKPYGPVDNILMRRIKSEDRLFKGSVFITFKNKEDGNKFITESPAKYNETSEMDLVKKWQVDYHADKLKERKELREKVKADKHNNQNNRNQKEPRPVPVFKPGCILRMTDIKDGVNREDIKKLLTETAEATVGWVFFNRGDTKADVRLDGEENCGQIVLDKLKEKSPATEESSSTDGLRIQLTESCAVTVSLLSGDEEQEVWKRPSHVPNNNFSNNRDRHSGGRGRGRGRGGHRGDRKRRDDRKDGGDEPKAKKQVFADSDEEKDAKKKEPAAKPAEAKSEPAAEAKAE